MNMMHFLKNLWAWRGVLWRDRDWDYAYLLQVMRFKMDRMSKCIESNDICDSSKRIAKQLRYAVLLLDRIDDGHYDRLLAPHEEKWGELAMDVGDGGVADFYFPTARELGCDKEARAEYRAICRKAEALAEEDYRRLFGHMRRRVRYWWD